MYGRQQLEILTNLIKLINLEGGCFICLHHVSEVVVVFHDAGDRKSPAFFMLYI